MKSAGIAGAFASAVVLALAFSTSPLAQKAEEAAPAPARPAAARPAPRNGANAVSKQRYGITVARLGMVEGTVLISQAWGLSAAKKDQRLDDHSRLITTANSRATVIYDDGCEVTLEANQRLEIENDIECADRLAQTESIFEAGEEAMPEQEPATSAGTVTPTVAPLGAVGAAVGSAAAPTVGAALGGGALVAGGLAGVSTIVKDRDEDAVSPN